jgi:hypothetical protein
MKQNESIQEQLGLSLRPGITRQSDIGATKRRRRRRLGLGGTSRGDGEEKKPERKAETAKKNEKREIY